MTDHALDVACRYLAAGWSPIPLPARSKTPPPAGFTGWRGRYVTQRDVDGWDWDGNIAIRLPPDVIGIDVDVYHDGTLDNLEQRCGPLPPTRWSTSRDDGSGIGLFRVPTGTALRTNPETGIDIIQMHHRYVICAPSLHRDTGAPYRWLDEADAEWVDGPGEPGDLPELPWAWIDELAATKDAAANAATPDQAAEFIEAHTTSTKPASLTGVRTKLAEVRPGGRHDALVAAACWAMREAAAGLYTAEEAVAALHRWWVGAMADEPQRREGGEFGAALLWAIGQATGDTDRIEIIRQRSTTSTQAPPCNVDPDTGEIIEGFPETFWDLRPALDHIRIAARARLVAPAAVLGCVLARIAAFTPPSSCLPPIIGGWQPLSLYIGLRGSSGAGKTSPMATAAQLIPDVPPGCIGPLALGSGEGLIETYFEMIDNDDREKGDPKRVKRKTRHGALFTLDEGQALAELATRRGSTILPILRSAWSGSDTGQANASIETRRTLVAGSYAVGLISLWQDRPAMMLLDDAEGGTPQRFVWLPTDDPHASAQRPQWPGPLDWQPPAVIGHNGQLGRHELDVDPDIEAEIVDAHVNRMRQADGGADLGAHRNLSKLKVAGCLAVLDGRHNINLDDWTIAETIMAVSDRTRAAVLAAAGIAAHVAEQNTIERSIRRETALEQSAEQRALQSAARSVARRVHRGEGIVGRRDLNHAIAGKHRQLVTIEEALAVAEQHGWIVSADDGWLPGESRPA